MFHKLKNFYEIDFIILILYLYILNTFYTYKLDFTEYQRANNVKMSHPDPCKELQMFPWCEFIKQDVVLWADAGDLADLIHVIGVGHIIAEINNMLKGHTRENNDW